MEEPVKKEEKVPVPVKSQPIYDAVAEQAYTAVERGIQRTAKFLGISEQQVVDWFLVAGVRIERLLGWDYDEVSAEGVKVRFTYPSP